MELTKKKNPPNPNGNPNFKKRWENFSDPVHVRIPPELHSLFKDLTTAINSGKIKTTDLENMCIDWGNVERELTAITGNPSLSIIQNPEKSSDELLEKLEQFEAAQRATWGTLPQHRGEFSTTSARWGKYNEFKAWLANQGE
jgi:hypothetical protein